MRSPQHFAPFGLAGNFYLAVASRADQKIQVFGRKDPVTLGLEPPIPLLPPDTLGGDIGLAVAEAAVGGAIAAALVEDADEPGLCRLSTSSISPASPSACTFHGGSGSSWRRRSCRRRSSSPT